RQEQNGNLFALAGGTRASAKVLAGTTLTGTSAGGKLEGVTLAGTLDLANQFGNQVTVTSGLTLSNGNINLGQIGRMFLSGTQMLGGTGTVTLVDGHTNNGLDVSAGSTLTIAAGVTIHGNAGY